jgi:hypothetical protein
MESEYFNFLIFDHETSRTRRLRIHKETLKIGFYLLAFILLSTTFFFCDYIQVKKKSFNLNRLSQEIQVQKSQVQFFSARIEALEKKLLKLKDADRRIRIIANLERGQETNPFIGMGGPSPFLNHEK